MERKQVSWTREQRDKARVEQKVLFAVAYDAGLSPQPKLGYAGQAGMVADVFLADTMFWVAYDLYRSTFPPKPEKIVPEKSPIPRERYDLFIKRMTTVIAASWGQLRGVPMSDHERTTLADVLHAHFDDEGVE